MGSKAQPMGRADKLTTICESIFYTYEYVGSLTSHTPIGLQGLLRDSFNLWGRTVLPVRYEVDCKYCYK
jgi:hypothetical protein